MMSHLRSATSFLAGWTARLLFPPACPGCGRLVSRPATLCAGCWPDLSFIEEPWCEILGTPFPHGMGDGAVSLEAIANPPPFDCARSAVAYSGVARRLVQALKYRDRTDLGPWMAEWMLRPGAELAARAELVVPVPLHWRRFLARRFNQSAELARAFARRCDIPFAPEVLRRVKRTRQQVGLGLREREANVRSAFFVPTGAADKVRDRRILLIDDVYTTGATVSAAARALVKGGASGVDVLTFARVLADYRSVDRNAI